MNDWIGLLFFVLLIVGIIVGLKILAKPQTRTSEEFERNAAEGTTGLGASMNALNEIMNPEAAKAKEVIVQMKEGRNLKKKREGKAGDDEETEGRGDESEPPASAGGQTQRRNDSETEGRGDAANVKN